MNDPDPNTAANVMGCLLIVFVLIGLAFTFGLVEVGMWISRL